MNAAFHLRTSTLFTCLVFCHAHGLCGDASPCQHPTCITQIATESGHHLTAHSLAWSPNCDLLVSAGADSDLVVYRSGDFREQQHLRQQSGSIHSIGFSPDGRSLASTGFDGTVVLWSIETPKILSCSLSSESEQFALIFLDKETVASGGRDGHIHIWRLPSLELVQSISVGAAVTSLVYCTTTRKVVVARPGSTEGIGVYSWDEGELINDPDLNDSTSSDSVVALNEEGSVIATAGHPKRGIRIWRMPTYDLLTTLPGHQVSTTALSFDASGKYLATTGQDGYVRVWKVATAEMVFSAQPFSSGVGRDVKFSPDGTRLAAAGGSEPGEVIVWSFKD